MRESFDDVYVNDGGYYANRLTWIMVGLVLVALLWVPVSNYVVYGNEVSAVEREILSVSGYKSHELKYDDVQDKNLFFVEMESGDRFVYWYDSESKDVKSSKVVSQTF